ncbi:SDR family oxidoreductase [Candidatus Chlorohelix sp.]|uniref:SDR family NAD(P)-dependent oxidoreductase n=1 Tax=Candidatus Chlorohelix sp. TaxID=3139201 RepID=UPI00303CC077
MYHYVGKTALITGASSGIGEVFARALAKRGMNLIIVARTESKLRNLAHELSNQYKVNVDILSIDLGKPGAAQSVHQITREAGWRVDLLVNNAGFSTLGAFETISPELEQQCVMVNIAALLDLTHAYIPDMLEQGEGAIINLASVLSFVGGGRQATYAATKAFVFSLSQALWTDYRKRGIRVFALCPGPVSTGFFDVMGSKAKLNFMGLMDKPERVVEVGLKAFEKGKPYELVSWFTNATAFATRILPRTLMSRIVYFMTVFIYKSDGK